MALPTSAIFKYIFLQVTIGLKLGGINNYSTMSTRNLSSYIVCDRLFFIVGEFKSKYMRIYACMFVYICKYVDRRCRSFLLLLADLSCVGYVGFYC
jgi:hypothetical protein